jgi:hypothetical protein
LAIKEDNQHGEYTTIGEFSEFSRKKSDGKILNFSHIILSRFLLSLSGDCNYTGFDSWNGV